MEGYGIMEIIVIEEGVCPRCDESGRGIDYIISEAGGEFGFGFGTSDRNEERPQLR